MMTFGARLMRFSSMLEYRPGRGCVRMLPQCQVVFARGYQPNAKPLAPVPRPKPPKLKSLPCHGVFAQKVCKFIAERSFENRNSEILAWVTAFTGENTLGIVQLNEFVFGANPRIDVIHRVVVWQRAKRRAGTACVKTRGEVRGGGRKPRPQKGTGRARQGSIRAPHYIGGGRAHGPKPKSYEYTLPKKVRRMGLRSALSVRYAQGDLHIVDSFKDIESERDLIPVLEMRGWTNAVLVDSKPNQKLKEAAADLERVDVLYSLILNVYTIIHRKNIILSLDAVKALEERLCEDDRIIVNKFD